MANLDDILTTQKNAVVALNRIGQLVGALGQFAVVDAKTIYTMPITVTALPAATVGNAGARAFVTDATTTTFASIVAGGGANSVPVYSDGINWRIG